LPKKTKGTLHNSFCTLEEKEKNWEELEKKIHHYIKIITKGSDNTVNIIPIITPNITLDAFTCKMEYKYDEFGKEILVRDDKYAVMSEWEKEYMEKCVDYLDVEEKDILEIGFGCGYSANRIQENNPKTHTIVECHPVVINKLKDWSKKFENIYIIEDIWQNVMTKLGKKYDRIFFDDFPASDNKFALAQFLAFIDLALKYCLKNKGIISCYLTESLRPYMKYFDVLYIDHKFDIHIPRASDYIKQNFLLIPLIISR